MKSKRGFILLLALIASPLLAESFLRVATGYDRALAQEELENLLARVTGQPAPETEPTGGRANALGRQRFVRVAHPFYGSELEEAEQVLEQALAEHLQPERDQRFHVWICGGSVASMFGGKSRGALAQLRSSLEALPAVQGKTVRFLVLARPGYKQPQQLGKLTYLLARGAVPDLVINVDGLNEMRGGMANYNADLQIPFPTPANWAHLITDLGKHPAARSALLRLEDAREEFIALAQQALDSKALHSAFLGSLKQRKVKRSFEHYNATEAAYIAVLIKPTAPRPKTPESSSRALEECLSVWSKSSQIMHTLCTAQGATYLHVLQPTLHDPGSKPISEREHELGIGPEGLDPRIATYYTALRERGGEMLELGLPFLDASRLFEEIAAPLYHDRAHFGTAGNRLLAHAIAQRLQELIQ